MNFFTTQFNSDVQIIKGDLTCSFTSPSHFFFLYKHELCLLSDNQGNCWASRMEEKGMEECFIINPYFMPPEICNAIKTGNFKFKSFTEIHHMAVELFTPLAVRTQDNIFIDKKLKKTTFPYN